MVDINRLVGTFDILVIGTGRLLDELLPIMSASALPKTVPVVIPRPLYPMHVNRSRSSWCTLGKCVGVIAISPNQIFSNSTGPRSGNRKLSCAVAHRLVMPLSRLPWVRPIEPMIKRSYLSRRRLNIILPVSHKPCRFGNICLIRSPSGKVAQLK